MRVDYKCDKCGVLMGAELTTELNAMRRNNIGSSSYTFSIIGMPEESKGHIGDFCTICYLEILSATVKLKGRK
jgi:hypothetical protein